MKKIFKTAIVVSENFPEDIKVEVIDISEEDSSREITRIDSSAVLFDKSIRYPEGFPNLKQNIDGNILDKSSFARLSPYENSDQYLVDVVVNAFFSLLPSIAERKGLSLLCFDTYFFEKILRKNIISKSFFNFAKKQNIERKNIWLIPINHINIEHWSLMLVVRKKKAIVYFDSLHFNPSVLIINAICEFIQRTLDEKWTNWHLYSPKDIPNQGTSGNCGVHVISWALHVATCCDYKFIEEDMNTARRSIAVILNNAQSIMNKNCSCKHEVKKEKVEKRTKTEDVKVDASIPYLQPSIKVPFGFDSTFQFCKKLADLERDS